MVTFSDDIDSFILGLAWLEKNNCTWNMSKREISIDEIMAIFEANA